MIILVIYGEPLTRFAFSYTYWFSFTATGTGGSMFYYNTGEARDPWKEDKRHLINTSSIEGIPFHLLFVKDNATYFIL